MVMKIMYIHADVLNNSLNAMAELFYVGCARLEQLKK